VSNVLNEEKKQQVIALGRLGWSLRRIEQAVHIRRETIGAYLRAAGIPVRPAGAWGRAPAKPANEVITDPTLAKAANEVITDLGAEWSAQGPPPSASRSASASAPFRDAIELGWSRGRNARAIWQDLVDTGSFTGRSEMAENRQSEHTEVIATKRGFPIYDRNPSVPSPNGLPTRMRPVKIANGNRAMIIGKDTGELLGDAHAAFFRDAGR
jgi:hypothetical protein